MISCSRQDSRYAPHIDQDASGRMLHVEREREKHFPGVYIMYTGCIDIHGIFCICVPSADYPNHLSPPKVDLNWCARYIKKTVLDASNHKKMRQRFKEYAKFSSKTFFCLKKVTLVEFPFCKMLQVAMRTAPALPSLVRNLRFQCGLFFIRPDELPDCYKQACGIV